MNTGGAATKTEIARWPLVLSTNCSATSSRIARRATERKLISRTVGPIPAASDRGRTLASCSRMPSSKVDEEIPTRMWGLP